MILNLIDALGGHQESRGHDGSVVENPTDTSYSTGSEMGGGRRRIDSGDQFLTDSAGAIVHVGLEGQTRIDAQFRWVSVLGARGKLDGDAGHETVPLFPAAGVDDGIEYRSRRGLDVDGGEGTE